MLKTLDVLIGLAVVMLVMSAVVTAMTQFLVHISQAKGRKLREGIADLMQLLAPQFERACAEEIAQQVLTHPLVRRSQGKLSDSVHREELVKLLLELSTATKGHQLSQSSRDSLRKALAADGIADPDAVLDNARSMMLQLELMKPELSNAMRSNLSLLQEANSRFLAKVNGWFDQTIDRTVDRFTAHVRALTLICSALLVAAIQLDTIGIVNQLSVDPQLRNALVQQAVTLSNAPPPNPTRQGELVQEIASNLRANQDEIQTLSKLGLFRVPHTLGQWWSAWSKVDWFGILISMVLLSLGAPFWYNALKTLLQFRSVVANKDDGQRRERQTLTEVDGATARPAHVAAATAGAGGSGAGMLAGERGFLG